MGTAAVETVGSRSSHQHDSSMDHINSLSASPAPSQSKRSAMMSIANMLNSPPAPTFSRESFQRKMSRQEPRSESHSPPPPPLLQQSRDASRSASPLSGREDRFIPEASPSVEASSRFTSRDSAATNDTALPPQRGSLGLSTSPVLPVPDLPDVDASPPVLEQRESPPANTFNGFVPEEQHPAVEAAISSQPEEDSLRPITPLPMVIPLQSTDHRWQSPAASSSHDGYAPEGRIMSRAGSNREPSSQPHNLPEDDKSERTPSPAPAAPLVIRGRLVTPPSRESTPTPAPSPGARRTQSSSTTESSTSEEEEESEESDDDDDDDNDGSDIKMGSDSDSLTPAPSPPPVQQNVNVPGPVVSEQEPVEVKQQYEVPIVVVETANHQELGLVDHSAPLPDDSTNPPVSTSSDSAPLALGIPLSLDMVSIDAPQSSSDPVEPPRIRVESEEPATPAVPVRRMTLKDYARRKKQEVVSPSTATSTTTHGPPPDWHSPLATRSVPLPESSTIVAHSQVPMEETANVPQSIIASTNTATSPVPPETLSNSVEIETTQGSSILPNQWGLIKPRKVVRLSSPVSFSLSFMLSITDHLLDSV